MIGLLLALLICFGYAFEKWRPLFWKLALILVSIIIIYFFIKICNSYCTSRETPLQHNNCRIYCNNNSTPYSITSSNSHYHESPLVSPIHDYSHNFDAFGTHSQNIFQYNSSEHVIHSSNHSPVIRTNHSFVRNDSMPGIASIDNSIDRIHDYIRTPPPKYEDVMKVNHLPNYKDAIQLQKHVKYWFIQYFYRLSECTTIYMMIRFNTIKFSRVYWDLKLEITLNTIFKKSIEILYLIIWCKILTYFLR